MEHFSNISEQTASSLAGLYLYHKNSEKFQSIRGFTRHFQQIISCAVVWLLHNLQSFRVVLLKTWFTANVQVKLRFHYHWYCHSHIMGISQLQIVQEMESRGTTEVRNFLQTFNASPAQVASVLQRWGFGLERCKVLYFWKMFSYSSNMPA